MALKRDGGGGLRLAALRFGVGDYFLFELLELDGGKRGSRRISATSLKTAGRFSRVVSIETLADVAPPKTPARAFSLSNSS